MLCLDGILETDMRRSKNTKREVRKSSCRKTEKTVVAYLRNKDAYDRLLNMWSGELWMSVLVTFIHSWMWTSRTGDWRVFSGWHELKWSSCPRVEKYVTEGMETAEPSMCCHLRLNGRLVPVPVSFSFQLSFLAFPQWVTIKLTCALKAVFASGEFQLLPCFSINKIKFFSRNTLKGKHLYCSLYTTRKVWSQVHKPLH